MRRTTLVTLVLTVVLVASLLGGCGSESEPTMAVSDATPPVNEPATPNVEVFPNGYRLAGGAFVVVEKGDPLAAAIAGARSLYGDDGLQTLTIVAHGIDSADPGVFTPASVEQVQQFGGAPVCECSTAEPWEFKFAIWFSGEPGHWCYYYWACLPEPVCAGVPPEVSAAGLWGRYGFTSICE